MLDQILALINAGFTAEQIIPLLGQMGTPPVPKPDGDPTPVPAPVSVPTPASVSVNAAPAPAPAPVPAADNPAPDLSGITQAIEAMGRNIIAALQKASIGGTPAPAPMDPMKQMDLITAQIINPTYNKKEDGTNG